jgi:Peptidase propeptide and YPEB domain
MRLFPILFALSLLIALPAAAQPRVTIDDVRNMAFAKGIVTIKDVDLDDGVWEVVGFDPYGAKIKMKVDAWSGAIIKLKRKY